MAATLENPHLPSLAHIDFCGLVFFGSAFWQPRKQRE